MPIYFEINIGQYQAMGTIEKILGSRFEAERDRLGLKRKDIKTASGASESAIYKFEKGKTMPGSETLDLMLKAIGTDTYKFLGSNKTEFEESQRMKSILSILSDILRLNQDQLEFVANTVTDLDRTGLVSVPAAPTAKAAPEVITGNNKKLR